MWILRKIIIRLINRELKQIARDSYHKGWGDGYTAKFEAMNHKTAIVGMPKWEQELENILREGRR